MAVHFRKVQLNEKNISIYVNLLKSIKMPFTVEVSNYTTKIISEMYNVHFMRSEQSNRVFAAYSKIKSDLKNIPVPDIDMSRNKYYDTCFKGNIFYSDIVHNIDIKNAYASIMLNNGFISKNTFDYINRMPKQERLAAMGMLASRKDIFTHNRNGSVIASDVRISPLSNFFFFCVQETERIIQTCVTEVLQDCFLFSWVDGIYYLNKNDTYRLMTEYILKEKFNLESSFQELTCFETILKNQYYTIRFIDAKERLKVFNIPLPESELKRKIINHLLTKKYD